MSPGSWVGDRSPADNVIVLDVGTARRSPATVNRHLSAVFGFYEHHAVSAGGGRRGVGDVASCRARLLQAVPTSRLKRTADRHPAGQAQGGQADTADLERRAGGRRVGRARQRARDRFLLALLVETGMRIGQALGLRHADFVSRAKEVHIVPRAANANGARAKLRSPATVPVTAALVRCYSDYMHAEYGELDSDYVFVNLWAGRVGVPMTYAAVHQLVGTNPSAHRDRLHASHAAPHPRHGADPIRRLHLGRGPGR